MDPHVEELVTEEEWERAFPVLIQLWEDVDRELTPESFVDLLAELRAVEGYRLFGLFVEGSVVAVAGVSIRRSAWYGRYAWVYDLVTDAEYRSRGHGDRLLSYVKGWAEDQGCETIALASALERESAHRFYEDAGMEKSSYVFTQSLE